MLNAPECPHCGRPMPSDRRPLTVRQNQILSLIRESIGTRGVAPSFAEIAESCGFRSLSTVHEHLQTLERKGHIRRAYNEVRSIELVAQQSSEVTQ